MTRCSAIGCYADATTTRDIVLRDRTIVTADYCTVHADAYDIALKDIEAWGERETARMEREADEHRRVYGR